MTEMASAELPISGEASPRRRLATLGPALSLAGMAASSLYLFGMGAGLMPAPSWLSTAAGLLGLACAATATAIHVRMNAAHGALKGVRAHLRKQTRIDPLTGLLNRTAFLEAFDDAETARGRNVSVLFIDLDNFKDVNDTMGHRAGDQVLIEVARRCEPILGDGAPFARFGGDEFAAIIPCDPHRPPESIGRAIVATLSEPMMIEGKMVSAGASVGIAIGSLELEGTEELLRRADLAMYEAKGSPHGACRVFDDALSSRQSLESSIRVELGQSILADELALAYQPVIDARTGKLASVEALLRWRSRQIGDVSPAALIPVAEQSGHIEKLTEWTLDMAFKSIRQLDDIGVAVNISPVYFRHPEFVHRIFDRLLAARIRPDLLTLEITEGVLISSIERAQQAIDRLRDIGVKIFLDDFGTGYSSLSYLQHFALDGLKLDKSFLRNVGDKRQATQIIRTMINFGHSLDMKVVVEGVENEWQFRLLQLIGCDLLQGFEIGAPMSIDDILKFKERNPFDVGASEAASETDIANHLRHLRVVPG